MNDLEKLLDEAQEQYLAGEIYRGTAFSEFPFVVASGDFWVASIVNTLILGKKEIFQTGEDIYWKDLHQWCVPFVLASTHYWLMATYNEVEHRTKTGGDEPRMSTVSFPFIEGPATLATTWAGLSQYYGGSGSDFAGAGLIAASLSVPLVRAARGVYVDAQNHAPLKTESLWQRVAHNIFFAYPESVAVGAGIAAMAFLPLEQLLSFGDTSGNGNYDAGLWFTLLKGNLGALGMYYGRAMAGNLLSLTRKGYHDSMRLLNESVGRREAALEHNKAREYLSVSHIEAVRQNTKGARIRLAANDTIGALHMHDAATRLSPRPFTKPYGFAVTESGIGQEKARPSKNKPRRLEALVSSDEKLVEKSLQVELRHERFSYAELFARRLIEIEPSAENYAKHYLTLHTEHRFDAAAEALAQYVRLIVPRFAQAQQAETLGESRHSVWRVPGPIPGYLRRMESAQRAAQEYEYALFFYNRLGNRVPTPVPPVEVDNVTYIFSPAYGDGTLLDMIRAGKARPKHMLEAADMLVDINRVALEALANGELMIPNPLSDDPQYLERRLQNAFIAPLREYGIEIDTRNQLALEDMVEMLKPYVLFLPRGIYRDLNPKNVVEGPSGLMVPIDWEELVLYPIQKDFLKLFEFGAWPMPIKLYEEVMRRVTDGTYAFLGEGMTRKQYFENFYVGAETLGVLVHMDMVGYAAKDELATASPQTQEWYRMAQGFHIMEAAEALRRNIEFGGNEFFGDAGIEKLDGGLEVMRNLMTNYIDYHSVTPIMPDVRRSNFQALREKLTIASLRP